MDLKFQCKCGQVTGTLKNLKPSGVNRVVCYCRFCQAYEQHLSGAKQKDQPGSDLFQMSPRDIQFEQGFEWVHAIKLTDKGPLRYYAKCCNTPLVNGLQNMKVPFTGVAIDCVPQLLEESQSLLSFGPIRARVNTHGAQQKALPKSDNASKYRMFAHLARLMFGWWLRGDAKRSPFINAQGQPVLVGERIRLEP